MTLVLIFNLTFLIQALCLLYIMQSFNTYTKIKKILQLIKTPQCF